MLSFTAGWVLRATHDLLLHHKHFHAVCEAAYEQDSNKHFHDERFAPEDPCPLCAVWFSSSELPEIPYLSLQAPKTGIQSCLPTYQAPEVCAVHYVIYRRGPPTV